MLRASRVSAELDVAALPALPGAEQLLASGLRSTAHEQNRKILKAARAAPDASRHPRFELLFDPQTGGGFLAGVPEAQEAAFLDRLGEAGVPAVRIGTAVPAPRRRRGGDDRKRFVVTAAGGERRLRFVKMSGAGNDFVLVDNREAVVREAEKAGLARRVCRRRVGVGADGLILIEPPGGLGAAGGAGEPGGGESGGGRLRDALLQRRRERGRAVRQRDPAAPRPSPAGSAPPPPGSGSPPRRGCCAPSW